jgi:Dolichyl-phosphate-mannose-protein mannosyltransferase
MTDPRLHGRSTWLRRHRLVVALVALGVLLRLVVMVAYRPALLFPDSFRYLNQAHHFYLSEARPTGYGLVLWPVAHLTGSLPVITAGQHLIGIALAVGCYAFLVRRGLPPWGAALAVAPLLLDPLQLVLEQYVLTDVVFEALLVLACLALLWHHRPGVKGVLVAGFAVGFAGLTRGAGSFLVVVFLVALLCLRPSWLKVVAFLVAAAVPLAGYASAYYVAHGQFAVVSSGPRFLYARLAPFVHCHAYLDELPSYERSLCPAGRVGERPDTDYFRWGSGEGPAYHVPPSHGMTQVQLIKDFDKRVVRAEPVTYARIVAKDTAGGFVPSRTYEVPGYPASYWLFEDHNWSLDLFPTWATEHHAQYPLRSQPTAARFLTAYRQLVWTPGPLMAVLLLVGVAAAAGVGRARRSGDRVAVGLLVGCCVVPLLTGAAFSGFSWRYQLPQIPLLPVAGALGLAALVRGRPVGVPPSPEPPTILDRWARWVGALQFLGPRRTAVRRAGDGGRLQVTLAVVAGAAGACVSAVLVWASGWATAANAASGGVVVGVLVAVVLLTAWQRGRARRQPGATPQGDTPPAHRVDVG